MIIRGNWEGTVRIIRELAIIELLITFDGMIKRRSWSK